MSGESESPYSKMAEERNNLQAKSSGSSPRNTQIIRNTEGNDGTNPVTPAFFKGVQDQEKEIKVDKITSPLIGDGAQSRARYHHSAGSKSSLTHAHAPPAPLVSSNTSGNVKPRKQAPIVVTRQHSASSFAFAKRDESREESLISPLLRVDSLRSSASSAPPSSAQGSTKNHRTTPSSIILEPLPEVLGSSLDPSRNDLDRKSEQSHAPEKKSPRSYLLESPKSSSFNIDHQRSSGLQHKMSVTSILLQEATSKNGDDSLQETSPFFTQVSGVDIRDREARAYSSMVINDHFINESSSTDEEDEHEFTHAGHVDNVGHRTHSQNASGNVEGNPNSNRYLAPLQHINLETLSSKATWWLLILPFFILAISILIDTNMQLRVQTTHINGTSPVCMTYPGYVENEFRFLYEQHCMYVTGPNEAIFIADMKNVPTMATFLTADGRLRGNMTDLYGYDILCAPSLLIPKKSENLSSSESSGTWETIFTDDPVDIVEECAQNQYDGYCKFFRILQVILDMPGITEGSNEYRLQLNFTGSQASTIARKMDFKIAHDRKGYTDLLFAVRCMLLLITLVTGAIWIYKVAKENYNYCQWMPEQQYIPVLYMSLILWQDPISLYLNFKKLPSMHVLFVSDLCHALGYQTLWYTWVLLMDGLRGYRVLKKGQVKEHMEMDNIRYPKHHPKNEYFCDYFFSKFAFYLIGFLFNVIVCIARHPNLLFGNFTDNHHRKTIAFYTSVSTLCMITVCAWVFLFIRSTIRTGRVLRHQPYMPSRAQQLSYRFLVQQAILVISCIGVSYVYVLFDTTFLLFKYFGSSQHVKRSFFSEQLKRDSVQFSYWASPFHSPPGELIFVSTCCYVMAFVFLPAKRWTYKTSSADGKIDDHLGSGQHPHVSLERHMKKIKFNSNLPVFCLETACWLMEVSWQSYYAVDTVRIDESTGEALDMEAIMDLSSLGLKLVKHFYDDETDTHAILARGRGRLVLAFRGTFTTTNAYTDMNVKQVPVPGEFCDKIAHPYEVFDNRKSVYQSREAERPLGNFYVDLEHGSNKEKRDEVKNDMNLQGGTEDNEDDLFFHQNQQQPLPDKERRFAGFRSGIFRLYRSCVEKVPVAKQTLPRVHAGFWKAYSSVRNEILVAVKEAFEEEYAPLVVTGHSLGGALGQLAAYDIQNNFRLPRNVIVYSYGCPPLGNLSFIRMYESKVSHNFRVTVDGDPIGCPPPVSCGFYHLCGYEVLVDANSHGNYIVRPTLIESILKTSTIRSTYSHSLDCYRDCLESCFEDSELLEYIKKVTQKGRRRKQLKEDRPDWLVGNRRAMNDYIY